MNWVYIDFEILKKKKLKLTVAFSTTNRHEDEFCQLYQIIKISWGIKMFSNIFVRMTMGREDSFLFSV